MNRGRKRKIGVTAGFILLLLIIPTIFSPSFYPKLYHKIMIENVDCPDTTIKRYSKKLNDKMPSYIELTKKNGIKEAKDVSELSKNKKLEKISDSRYYIIDKLTHSYPYLTEDGEDLLETIGERFQEKLEETDLEGTKFILTSLTRTTESVKKLRKRNSNSSMTSAHFHGECFDIAYARFERPYTRLKDCHIYFLKETLASVLLDLKKEKKCWALTERKIPCFHVVSR